MNHSFGFVIESAVAVLLMLTIGYCMLLNARLKRLRSDEQALKATIGELITATEIAERAIGGLKLTVRDCNEHLGAQIDLAASLTERLVSQIDLGNDVVRRLSRIALAARPSQETSQPEAAPLRSGGAQAIAAAAKAFSERRQASGLAA